MPVCRLTKFVPIIGGQVVECRQMAVLLKYGDRWEVLDPSNNNVLIAGMTTAFKDRLVSKGFLEILGDVT